MSNRQVSDVFFWYINSYTLWVPTQMPTPAYASGSSGHCNVTYAILHEAFPTRVPTRACAPKLIAYARKNSAQVNLECSLYWAIMVGYDLANSIQLQIFWNLLSSSDKAKHICTKQLDLRGDEETVSSFHQDDNSH